MVRYLKIYALVALAGLMAVAAFNVLIDPFEVFRLIEVPGLNLHTYGDGDRKYKALALRYPRYEGIILGTSRAQVGLRPDHDAFAGMDVYNVGLPGSSIWEQRKVLDYALRHQPLKLVIVTLDLHAFAQKVKYRPGWKESGFNLNHPDAISLPDLVLSKAALDRSWDTMLRNGRAEPPTYFRGHTLIRSAYSGRLQKSGHAPAFAKFVPPLAERLDEPRSPDVFAASMTQFEAILSACEERGIDVVLLITPVHAYWWESRYRAGRGPLIDAWKRALVQTVYSPKRARAVPLWDFSGYSGIVAEPVPEPGDAVSRMKWYWEPSHYRSALGDLMLDRVLNHHAPGRDVPPDFGTVLTPENIEEKLAGFWKQRERFTAERRDEIAALERIAPRPRQK